MTLDGKNEEYMTIEFTKTLVKISWLANVVVGVFFMGLLLVSDQMTRSSVYQARDVETSLSKEAIEKAVALKVEVDELKKRLAELRADMKGKVR